MGALRGTKARWRRRPLASLDRAPAIDLKTQDSGVVGVRDGKGMGRSCGGGERFLGGQASMDPWCGSMPRRSGVTRGVQDS